MVCGCRVENGLDTDGIVQVVCAPEIIGATRATEATQCAWPATRPTRLFRPTAPASHSRANATGTSTCLCRLGTPPVAGTTDLAPVRRSRPGLDVGRQAHHLYFGANGLLEVRGDVHRACRGRRRGETAVPLRLPGVDVARRPIHRVRTDWESISWCGGQRSS
jgi:hypothetical protein